MGDELVRIEMPDGFLTIPASFGGNRLKMMLIEARSFAEFVYNSSREKGDGMCEAAVAALTKIPKQDGKAPRYPEVGCSQCGRRFGPGDHGFSHCDSHKHLKGHD